MEMMDGEKEIQKAYEAILQNDFEQAIEWFERAIAAEPNHADYHYKLSVTCARSNKLQKAVEHAETAVRLEPENEQYRFHINTLKAKELLHQAEKFFDGADEQQYLAIPLLHEAIALDALSVDAYLLLGLAYANLQDYGLAIQAIKEAVRLDPQNDAAKALLAEYKLQLKQYLGSN
jgi:tetratricopeptide (TPR) repeat protein